MPPLIASLAHRLSPSASPDDAADAAAPARCRVPSRRARDHGRDRERAGADAGLSPDLGPSQFLLAGAAAPAGACGRPVARDLRGGDLDFAVQASRPLDDRELHGPDDHRCRDRGVPVDDIAGGSHHRDRRGRGRAPGARAALARRSLARTAADRGSERRGVLCRPGGAFRSHSRCPTARSSPTTTTSPSSCAPASRPCISSRPRAIWKPTPR